MCEVSLFLAIQNYYKTQLLSIMAINQYVKWCITVRFRTRVLIRQPASRMIITFLQALKIVEEQRIITMDVNKESKENKQRTSLQKIYKK